MNCATSGQSLTIAKPVKNLSATIVATVPRTVKRGKNKMDSVNGFIIFDKVTGNKFATLPLTVPIGATVEAYERAGHQVAWTWSESND